MGKRIINLGGGTYYGDGSLEDLLENDDVVLNLEGGTYIESIQGDVVQGDAINLQGNVVSDGTSWWQQEAATSPRQDYSTGDAIDVQAAPVEEPKHTKPWWME